MNFRLEKFHRNLHLFGFTFRNWSLPGYRLPIARSCDSRRYQHTHMTDDLTQVALATWAAKDLPARLLAGQVAKLLNCSTDDVAILVSAGKLRALGKPRPNAVKFFSTIELIALLADSNWLDDATKTIGQYWKRKNARRNWLTTKEQSDAVQPMAAL